MKAPRTPRTSPGRIIVFATGGAVLLVIIGSLVALYQIGITPAVFAGYVSEAVSRLAGADLIVKVDQTTLPADGKTTTIIHISTDSNVPIAAKLISGGGTITAANAGNSGDTAFIYTTGTTVGTILITITSGSLTEDVHLTLKEAIVPATPTIVAPSDGSTTNNPKPEVSGTGPASTKLLLTDNGNTNTTATIDDKGNFRVVLDNPLYSGKHTLAAITSSELGVLSTVSNLITITVESEPIKLDTAHIRTAPSKIVAGDSFGLFVPASLNTVRITVELQGKTYELQDLHKTSIFTGTLPAPEQSGTVTANLIAYDLAGNTTRFDKALNLLIVSP